MRFNVTFWESHKLSWYPKDCLHASISSNWVRIHFRFYRMTSEWSYYISRNKLRGRSNICMVCSNHFSIKFSLAFWGSYLHIFSTFSSKYFIITFYGLHFEKIYSRVHVAFEISNFTIELSKKLFQYILKSATNIYL